MLLSSSLASLLLELWPMARAAPWMVRPAEAAPPSTCVRRACARMNE